MGAVGIIAEYNPFHSGHAWHIAETRRQLGEEKTVICVMSGNWVQRGECALTDKWTRAAMALSGGADLVIELPLPWAISSAEGFAKGGIAILKGTGVVDTLSFGSESNDVEALCRMANAINTSEFHEKLAVFLDKGISFAEARQKALQKILGKKAALLTGPNDNLGVEYIRAAGDIFDILTVPRQGSGHDGTSPTNCFASASYLRDQIRQGNMELTNWMSKENISKVEQAGRASMAQIERAMLARLRQMREEDFAVLPDSGEAEGLPLRLMKAAAQANGLEEFYALAKTRRYAHSRIRRLALWAFLGLSKKDRPDAPAYLRVLGANGRGRELLREIKKKGDLPVLTKPAHIQDLSEKAQELFSIECRGTDMFGLCFDSIKPCGMDYTTGPVILK